MTSTLIYIYIKIKREREREWSSYEPEEIYVKNLPILNSEQIIRAPKFNLIMIISLKFSREEKDGDK